MGGVIAGVAGAVVVAFVAVKSLHLIGSAQVGLVSKRFARRRLGGDNPVAFRREAGYQATMLMPGLRLKLWLSDESGERWGAVELWESAEDAVALPLHARERELIGKDPEVGEEFDLEQLIERG